ncbi:hypothetical protein EZV62_016330 [Acer yangbiense]|uniref:Plastocyanin-like domain-containing protein n=1 Tax=Acer yangbiense TaxID=1000413 RepID=A0A5C7HNC9_9ROSI|nr:hypothetical protein EZV62_016330 [Acer yangbiense]
MAMDNISAFLIVCFVGFLAFPAEAAVKNYQFDACVWFMHCHMELHTMWGLNMAFVVENGKSTEESVLPPLKDLPPC